MGLSTTKVGMGNPGKGGSGRAPVVGLKPSGGRVGDGECGPCLERGIGGIGGCL